MAYTTFGRVPQRVNSADSSRGKAQPRTMTQAFGGNLITFMRRYGLGRVRATVLIREQVYSGKVLALLAYQSIGVIYGDIGTSPLYVFSSTFSAPPSREDVIGALSLIIWSLIMMVTLKYVIIILRADNNGEGGTFSTYSLLSRYVSNPIQHGRI
jgi:hypothetical protein